MPSPLPRHEEVAIGLGMPPAEAFARLDGPLRLAAHMASSSSMMAGASMRIETDAAHGQAIGSHIRLSGRVLGLDLLVEEEVTEYAPPWRKAWRTLGEPRLLVIGAYGMGFEVEPREGGSRVRLWIDYELPSRGPARWLGRLLGGVYARWCTARMLPAAARA